MIISLLDVANTKCKLDCFVQHETFAGNARSVGVVFSLPFVRA